MDQVRDLRILVEVQVQDIGLPEEVDKAIDKLNELKIPLDAV